MAKIRLHVAMVVLALAILPLAAEPPEANKLTKSGDVQKVMDKYRAVRPGAKDLEWFSLDRATSLKEAKERAAKEQRPILFLHTNGRGNLFCGFC
jgi:hypothetical protein